MTPGTYRRVREACHCARRADLRCGCATECTAFKEATPISILRTIPKREVIGWFVIALVLALVAGGVMAL